MGGGHTLTVRLTTGDRAGTGRPMTMLTTSSHRRWAISDLSSTALKRWAEASLKCAEANPQVLFRKKVKGVYTEQGSVPATFQTIVNELYRRTHESTYLEWW